MTTPLDSARDPFASRPARRAAMARAAALLPAAAFGLGGWTLAHFQSRGWAAAAAETAYLATWGAFVLAGAALLAPARTRGALLAPVVAALALWTLPAGPARGVAMGVWLVATAALAAWARLRPAPPRGWDGAAWLGLALALHGLLRPADLLPAALSPLAHGPGPLARVLLPPLAAALALTLLGRRRGPAPALGAAIAAALAAAGFTATAALALLALALAGEVAARRETASARRAGAPAGLPAGVTAPVGPGGATPAPNRAAPAAPGAGASAAAISGSRGALASAAAIAARLPGGLAIALGALALVALTLLRPAAGGLALAAGAAAALPGLPGLAAAALPLVAGLGLALGRGEGLAASLGELSQLWQLALLVPVALLPGKAPERALLAALLLAAGGVLLLPAPPALAAAAALLALAHREGVPAAAAQRAWQAALVALAALAAAYPWLRPAPLLAAAALLGVPAGWLGAVVVLGGALVAAGAAQVAMRGGLGAARATGTGGDVRRPAPQSATGAGGQRAGRAAAAVALLATLVALVAALPPRGRDVLRGVAVELAGAGSWSQRWRGPVSWLRVESLLTGAGALPAGTAVAEVRLVAAGRTVDRLVLRAGFETAEWAADRAELRGRAAEAPAALSWVAPDGASFGHAYRATWRPRVAGVDGIVVARAAGLPPETVVVVRRLEVAR